MTSNINHFTKESKPEAHKRIASILERAEPHSKYPCPPGTVHRAFFLYELRWSQHQARIFEMNKSGWTVTSIDLPKHQWVSGIRTAYRLDSKPLKTSEGRDWYEREHGPRPKSHPFAQPFSDRRLSQDDCFTLVPPEPRA